MGEAEMCENQNAVGTRGQVKHQILRAFPYLRLTVMERRLVQESQA